MAKFNHENSYFYMFFDEDLDVEYNFNNVLQSGDSLATPCTVTIKNSEGVDKSASMITGISVSSPFVSCTVQNPTAVDTYEIKIVCNTSNSKTHVGKIVCDVYESVNLITYLGAPNSNSYCTLKEANDYIRNVRGHSNSWDTLSAEGKKHLLIQACRDINRFNYIGKKYYDNQSLEFPRNDHPKITGDCATPLSINSFKNTSFTTDTYGSYKSNNDYWKYGTVHITNATPLYDIRNVDTSSVTTDIITVTASLTATPTVNTDFICFEPLDTKIKYAQCEQALHILESEGSDTLQNYKQQGAERVSIGDVDITFKQGAISRPSISSKAKQLLSQWLQRYRKVLRA